MEGIVIRQKINYRKLNKKKPKCSRRRRCREEEGNVIEENADDGKFNKLSIDLITSIFIRCPMNTLSMLKCASKSWNDFITSPFFVHAHLERSTEHAQCLSVEEEYFPRADKCRLRFFSTDMEGKGESNKLYTVTVPEYQLGYPFWVVHSGLVCFSTRHRICLCNPVMQQFCKLPECSPTVFPGHNVFGFGYLHSMKEFKVLHIFYSGPMIRVADLQVSHLRCEVFTLNGVSYISDTWKEIAETPPCHPFMPGLVVNECMYWFAKENLYTKLDRIVSFDFENEKFLTISCPSSFETVSGMAMMDLKGMLCLVDRDRFRRSSILDIWKLKDNISCTWVKEYSIDFVNFGYANATPIFRSWNGEIIFMHSDKFVFCDVRRKCFREVERPPTIGFEVYQKSLFSLGST